MKALNLLDKRSVTGAPFGCRWETLYLVELQ
jgi:hypothetical protein